MSETSTPLDLTALHEKVRRIEIVSNRLVNERVAGEYHSVFKGQGIEFEEVRPYIPGDDIRAIDWNVTARAGTPHIKRYREEREMTVFFVVDVSGSCRFGSTRHLKSELMAEISAVLALAATANNDRVGLLLTSDRIEKAIPPRKGRRHVLRLVREMLAHEPEGHGTDLAQALEHLRFVLHHRSVVFLISDFMTGGYEKALSVASRRHDLIAIAVEDPLEQVLPRVGLLEVIDAETGRPMVVDTNRASVRRRFEALGRERREALRQGCRRHDVDLIELSTDRPYDQDLIQFFRRRARRLSR